MLVTASWGGSEVAVEVDAECQSVAALRRCVQEALPKLDVEAVRLEVCGRSVDDEGVLGLVDGSVVDISVTQAALAVATLREERRDFDFGAVCRAAVANDVRLCRLYVEAGVVWPSWVENPLHIAVKHSHYAVTKQFIDLACAMDLPNHDGNTPLHVAILTNKMYLAKLLLDAACATDVQNNAGSTPLHIVARMRKVQFAQYLLDAGCAKNVKDVYSRTPLSACREGTQLHAYLLSRGCV